MPGCQVAIHQPGTEQASTNNIDKDGDSEIIGWH